MANSCMDNWVGNSIHCADTRPIERISCSPCSCSQTPICPKWLACHPCIPNYKDDDVRVFLSVHCNAWHWTDIKSRDSGDCMSLCHSVCLSEIPIVHDGGRSFCPIFLKFGMYVTHLTTKTTSSSYVWWPTPEVVYAYARQFASGLVHFWLVSTIMLPFLVRF